MMRDPRSDDTLSAYLDGELSEQERQAVERRLAESPDAQQLLNEFQTIRGALRGLPRQHLDPAFRDRVLDQIARAVGGTDDQPDRERSDPPTKWWRLPIGRSWRALAWPAIAIAVSVVLMIIRSEPAGPRGPLAQRPEEPAPDHAASKPVASDRETSHQKKSAASVSTRLEARPPTAVRPRQIGPSARSSAPAAKPPTATLATPPTGPHEEPPSPAAGGPSREMAAGRPVGGGRAVGVRAKVVPPSSRVLDATADRGPASLADRIGFGEEVTRPNMKESPHVIVVRLAVDRPAVARRTLAKMFDRQHIVDTEGNKVYDRPRKRQAGRAGIVGPTGERAASEQQDHRNRAAPAGRARSSSVRRANPLRPAVPAGTRAPKPTSDAALAGRPWPKPLLVEATPREIRQSLAAIRSRTDLFTGVVIDGGVVGEATLGEARSVETTGKALGKRDDRQDRRMRVLFVLERPRPVTPQPPAAVSPAEIP